MFHNISNIVGKSRHSQYNGLVLNSKGDMVSIEEEYPRASGSVDGLSIRDSVPNTGSIGASFDDPEVLNGIRVVSLDGWSKNLRTYFYAADDFDRVESLAEQIKQSGEVNPLIVGLDEESDPYIVEGLHRLGALIVLNKKAFPALIVRESFVSDE